MCSDCWCIGEKRRRGEKWGLIWRGDWAVEGWEAFKISFVFHVFCLYYFGLTKSSRNCACCRRWSHATSAWRADWQQPQLHRARAASVAESVEADGGGGFLLARDGDAAWPPCYAALGYSSLRSRCSRCCSACASTVRHSLMHTQHNNTRLVVDLETVQ